MPAYQVDQIIEDNEYFKTFIFNRKVKAKPGQFVMVWLPGVDEIPISYGWVDDKKFWLGIGKMGDCSGAILEKIKVGDKLGIRGPYGNSFTLNSQKHIVLIGGGIGTPPLLNLAQKAAKKEIKITAILGARSADRLIYEKEFEKLNAEIFISTDDGSKGHHGYCTEVLHKYLKNNKPDTIYTCGPEMMMMKVVKLAEEHKIESEVCLERYMKCGFGLCGQCCMDDSGFRVCKDGPVMSGKKALEHPEFGSYHRAQSGKRIGNGY